MVVVKDYKEVDRNQWSEFVSIHHGSNIFHTPEMFDLYNSGDKYEPIFISVLTPNKEICGLLIAYIHKEYKGFIGQFTSRAIIYGGPLVIDNKPEIANLLLIELDKICRKKAVYSQFRNLWDVSCFKYIFNQKGFIYEEHLNFIFDLEKGEELLWSRIHPTRRKQIKRGIRREIRIKIVDILMETDLERCYNILSVVYKSAKLPVPSLRFFQRAVQILSPSGLFKVILATFQGEIVGFRFFLCYQGLLYDWYAGSIPDHHDKYANDILPWELIKWGIANGYSTFDFGGAGKPYIHYGVRDYKMKFGGDMVNFGRFEKVHKPFVMKLARIGLDVWKLVNNQV